MVNMRKGKCVELAHDVLSWLTVWGQCATGYQHFQAQQSYEKRPANFIGFFKSISSKVVKYATNLVP